MNIFKKCLVVFACITLSASMISCDDNAELRDQYNSLFTEVIAIHDELMPEMGKLTELQEQLQAQDSITSAQQEALDKLKESDNRMMSWMHDFTDTYVKDRTPVAKMTAAELQENIKGLKTELEEVKELRDFTNESIASAQKNLK
ncbi:hypothetical protein DSM03_101378 [Leeuwenhoekiella aestuarii]|uniref:Viral A-type inclusion protein n=1 Tax=Leeuwenhoekiella aestuarii TaxID=2249426 RepID=A0A4Q0NUH7_9FLAO|nr:hypothetical protein [Leeuwenhoekiella aestuarii]RXG14261.1 hypothetical protein DSM04_104369 [Leeuwenhoekiella aestuarii]RXG19010.1 hypothetical protein DSM03_101378 [Leeuwenhoekiella aestuarii]